MILPRTYICVDYTDLGLMPYADSVPLLLTGIESKQAAILAKKYLLQFFDKDYSALFILGTEKSISIDRIDAEPSYKIGTDAAKIFVDSAGGFDKKRYTFGDLLRITAFLTAPDGCPWDKEQTHESIRLNMIEEAYEAVDAIDGIKSFDPKDPNYPSRFDNLIEELGDVLLQSVLHSDIALRANEFDINDVISRLCHKLYHRHTHIFGQNKAKDSADALMFWDKAKTKEKNYDSLKTQLKKYPPAFAALLKAQKIFKKFDGINRFKTGTDDYLQLKQLFENSIKQAAAQSTDDKQALFAKILFLTVGLCSVSGFDAELVLNKLCNRIIEKSDNNDLLKILEQE